MSLKIAFLFVVLVLLSLWVSCGKASVSYDHKAISINGKRKILISGSIHYPRSTPEMWPDLIQKGKEGGLDVIETYVFWNGHEPEPGKYYFEGRYDLVKFIKLVQHAGLYVNLRIGPYVCAEWNFGGFPVWLKYVPGMNFRTDNGPFKDAMQRFTTKIVEMMKAERLYESQGGPIILSQIENEFGPLEDELGPPALAYTKWAAEMAVDLDTRVPWTMGKQVDAPDPVINTCNGFYCDWFYPNKPYKPKMWSEAWTGWFTEYGGTVPYRPAEDMAFSVARFIQTGGSFINYYMFHGGTNFGRTSGAFMATSYDYDAPLDEYGLLRQPKWGHLRDLHRAIKLCEPALISGDPNVTSLGDSQEARVFRSKDGACAAFLANYDQHSAAKVSLWNMQFSLPPWSISILPDCKNAVYNTARIGAQRAEMKMTPVSKGFDWQSYSEDTSSAYDESSFTQVGLREQINTTWDRTDYLWYTTEVEIDHNEGFLRGGKWPVLTVNSAGHGLHVFINGRLSGTAYGRLGNPILGFNGGVNLKAGVNKISLLSMTVGLPNVGTHFERQDAGVLGPVSLSGLNEGKRDLTWQKWTYKIGLKGESLSLHSPDGVSKVRWNGGSSVALRQPLTWYKTTFNAPWGNEPLALDMDSMSKGHVWINGESIGRYWSQSKASGNCSECSYAGLYDEKKCHRNCGRASQRWYHVPRSWLQPTGNLMVVFEEWGGNPNGITLTKREVARVSADIYESQPSFGKGNNKLVLPNARLSCDAGQKISSIKYAYGTPQGAFGSFRQGSCHAFHSYDVYNETCVGQQSCTVPVTPEILGGDPCPRVEKKLSVEAICS